METRNDVKKKTDARVLTTPECRLSFPQLWKPKAFNDGEPKFGCTLLIPPDADLRPFALAIRAAMDAEWSSPIQLSSKNNPLKDCATYEYPSGRYDGYEDGWKFLRVSSKVKPGVFSRALVQLTDEESDRVYPGMWVKARLNAYAWSHKTGGKGVSFGLQAIQLIRDGERLDGRLVNPEEAFEKLSEDAELPPGAANGSTDPMADLFG